MSPENTFSMLAFFTTRSTFSFFCLLDAPNKESIVKHHEKHGFKCEWVTEVKTTA